jgi:flagellar FliL protein
MKKVLKIFGIIGQVFLITLVVVSSLLSLAVAYIVFAPDDLPKPFYLNYIYPTPEPTLDPLSLPLEEIATEVPKEEILPGEGIMIDTGTKIINLAEPGGRRYIRIGVVLEFVPPEADPEAKPVAAEGEGEAIDPVVEEFTTEVNARLPMINDTVITLLSSKSFEQLYTTEGKEALRHEIMEKIQSMMPHDELLGVYFTEFVVE